MGLLVATVPKKQLYTENALVYPENATLPKIEPISGGDFYLLILLAALLSILLSLLVYLMTNNRRRLVQMYCKKQQSRHFMYEDSEYDSPLERDLDTVEEEEDEVDNENNSTKSLLRGKLQINNRYENYLSTSQLNRSSQLLT